MTSPDAWNRRFHGAVAASPWRVAKVRERACVGRVGLPDEVVEQTQQRRRRHPLVLLQLQLEVVVVAERAREAVAEADQLEEPVVEHPAFDVAEGVERALAPLFDAVGRQVGGEHRQRGDFPLPLLVQMARLVGALLLEQDGFGIDDLAHERAAVRAVDDVGFEEGQPSAEAVQQRIAFGARRGGADRRQLVAGLRQLGWIADELLVGALGAREAGLVVARGHVGGPEQIFLGLCGPRRRRDSGSRSTLARSACPRSYLRSTVAGVRPGSTWVLTLAGPAGRCSGQVLGSTWV